MQRLVPLVIASVVFACAGAASAQKVTHLMMPDSTNDRVVLFDPFDGSVVDEEFIDLEPLDPATPNHAITVGDEIWITDQLRDRIDRFTLDGDHLGAIGGQVPGGGLDNIRGLAHIGDTVYVANAGTDWDAPGTAVVMIDPETHALTGNFTVGVTINSPWFILDFGENLLVSTINTPHNIEHHTTDGTFIDTFYFGDPVGNARFIQQIHWMADGNLLAAGFSSAGGGTAGVYIIDQDGNEVGGGPLFTASGPRGVWELGNGNILWSNAAGAHIYDVTTGESSPTYVGTGRMFGALFDEEVPCPGDLTDSDDVGVDDLLILLADWGRCDDPADCPADLDGDGDVGVDDLLILLANWGPCP